MPGGSNQTQACGPHRGGIRLDDRHGMVERVEDIGKRDRFEIVTARAFAPMPKALRMLAPLLKKGTRALLYKGPDVETEMAEAARDAKSLGVKIEIVMRYELPDGLGTRSMVQIAR